MPPANLCFVTALLLILLGVGESYFGARSANVPRQRGGYGMLFLAAVFLLAGIVLSTIGVR